MEKKLLGAYSAPTPKKKMPPAKVDADKVEQLKKLRKL